MKKLLLIAASGIMIAGLTSCKKDHTCTCDLTYSVSSSDPNYTSYLNNGYTASGSETRKAKKKDAEEWCEGENTTSSGTYTDYYWDDNYDLVNVTITETTTVKCALD